MRDLKVTSQLTLQRLSRQSFRIVAPEMCYIQPSHIPKTGVCIRNTEKRKKFTPTLFQASIVEFPRKADKMNLRVIKNAKY